METTLKGLTEGDIKAREWALITAVKEIKILLNNENLTDSEIYINHNKSFREKYKNALVFLYSNDQEQEIS